MIFVGKRMCGKTYMAIEELKRRIKSNQTVGILARYQINADYIISSLKNLIKDDTIKYKKITLSDIETRKDIDLFFIEDIDVILGKNKIIGTSSGVKYVNRVGDDIVNQVMNNTDDYSVVDNIIKNKSHIKAKIQFDTSDLQDALDDYKNMILEHGSEYNEEMLSELKNNIKKGVLEIIENSIKVSFVDKK